MPYLRFCRLFTVIILFLTITSCGSSSSSDVVSLSFDDGDEDISVDQAVLATFSNPVDVDTVTTSSYFIVEGGSLNAARIGSYAILDSEICDSSLALSAAVSCATSTSCTLTPTASLEYSTTYSICMTTDIHFQSTFLDFPGFMTTFITQSASNPSVTITSGESTLVASESFTITITFSEEVTGFELSDISVTNGTASDLEEVTANKVYTATITASDDPVLVSVSIAADSAINADESGNTASNTFTITHDSTALTLSVTSSESGSTNLSPFEVSVVFSEVVSGFELADITVVNGAASNLDTSDNKTFTVDITPTSEGTVSVSVAASVATDENTGGKNNTASSTFSITYDETDPTVSTTTPANSATAVSLSSTIAVTFLEPMDTDTITTNTANTSCSGSLQLSSDNFSTCIQMNAQPVASNSDKTFTMTPSSSLALATTYKIKVSTSAMDLAGNTATAFTTSSGFTIQRPIYLFDTDTTHVGDIGNRLAADQACYDSWNNDHLSVNSKCSGDNVRALLCYTGGDDVVSMPTNYSLPSSVEIRGPNETKIANNWADLLDSSILVRPFNDAAAATSQTFVWTGCNTDGTVNAANCSDWTGSGTGRTGDTGVATGNWINGSGSSCGDFSNKHHYCVCWD